MFKIVFTLEGQQHETEFQAPTLHQAAQMFASVFPDIGTISVISKNRHHVYLVRNGQASLVHKAK